MIVIPAADFVSCKVLRKMCSPLRHFVISFEYIFYNVLCIIDLSWYLNHSGYVTYSGKKIGHWYLKVCVLSVVRNGSL